MFGVSGSIGNAQSEESGSVGSYSAAYEFYGRTPYPLNSRGVRIGYAPQAASEIQMAYVWSSQKLLLTNYSYRECSLQLKQLLSSVIFWEIGAGIREVNIDSNVFLAKTDSEEIRTAAPVREEYQAISLSLGFGFEYQITANFLIGSSLFNLSSPIHWLKKSSNFPENADESEEDPKEFPYLRDGLRTNFQLLRTFIKVKL